MFLTYLEKYLLLQTNDLHGMICRCHMYLIKVGDDHMNRQEETRIDEGLRNYHSLNI